MQPLSLTPAQRERHLRLIEDALSGQQPEGTRIRGKVEFAVVVAALLAIFAAALIWGSLGDDEPDEANVLATADATLVAREQATAGALTTSVLAALPDYDPGACAVTPFAANPPDSVPRHDPAFADWYGAQEGGLWAAPLDRGTFRQGPIAADTLWFAGRTSYVMWHGTTQSLMIRGEQLRGDASFTAGPASHTSEATSSQWTAFEIPEPGCWAISAQSAGASLEIVVSVAPIERRPDIIYLERVEAARPYDPPSTCAISPVLGPDATSDWYVAAYAVQTGGMLMSANQAWLAANRAEPLHITGEALSEGADIYARQVGIAVPFQTRTATHEGRFGVVEFPHAGCWEVAVETPNQSHAFTVYVYPADCAPSSDDLRIATSCRNPDG